MKFANDWIRTANHRCNMQLLYQLSHNHSPCIPLYPRIIVFNGPIPSSFCLISSFPHDNIQIQIDKSVDGVLGTQTRTVRMEGADKSTELWQHPMKNTCLSVGLLRCLSLQKQQHLHKMQRQCRD